MAFRCSTTTIDRSRIDRPSGRLPGAFRTVGSRESTGRAGRSRLPGLVLLALSLTCADGRPEAGDTDPVFSDDGYRIADFMAPVPASVPGAVHVATEEVQALLAAGDVALIDVLPAPPRPENLPSTSLWLPPVRRNLPGSTWLPNVGYGRLSDQLENYFRRNLERLSGSRPDRKIVVYCLANCWMSWNAAKRAAELGYTWVYWYADGTASLFQ